MMKRQKRKEKVVSVRLYDELLERVEKDAYDGGRKFSDHVRYVLELNTGLRDRHAPLRGERVFVTA